LYTNTNPSQQYDNTSETEKQPQKGGAVFSQELANQAWVNLSTTLKALEVHIKDLPEEEDDEENSKLQTLPTKHSKPKCGLAYAILHCLINSCGQHNEYKLP
jgi:hypothetical protein